MFPGNYIEHITEKKNIKFIFVYILKKIIFYFCTQPEWYGTIFDKFFGVAHWGANNMISTKFTTSVPMDIIRELPKRAIYMIMDFCGTSNPLCQGSFQDNFLAAKLHCSDPLTVLSGHIFASSLWKN